MCTAMNIVHLSVKHFRGIRSLEWSPPAGAVCLVGRGDSGKTTLLEAIELALFPRWFQFVESDFFGNSTADAIEIEVTVIGVPAQLLTQDKFGLEQRGWTADGEIRDEPEDDDEPALTIRLRVDDALEPTWHVASERNQEGRTISARDRDALGVARIGDDVERQLSWVRGSSLAHVTGSAQSISAALAEAHRSAREAVSQNQYPQLSDSAAQAGEWGVRYGAQLDLPLTVGVDPRQLNVGSGALSLRQDSGVPASAIGLGSRRLLGLAIQRQAIASGVVTLVDEIEYGLEPHRLRHLLNELRNSGLQVLMTTHSETAVAELGSDGLALVRRDEQGDVEIRHPSEALQSVIRALPEAILGRKVIVCEGSTEWGMSRSLVLHWDESHDRPLASIGAVFVPGGGGRAAKRAAEFRQLGFPCIYWGDSDAPTNPTTEELDALGVEVITWADNLSTEQRIMADVPSDVLERLWDIAAQESSESAICDRLASALDLEGRPPRDWNEWGSAYSIEELRSAFGIAASTSGWYKNTRAGQRIGAVIADVLDQIADTDLAIKLEELRSRVYGD